MTEIITKEGGDTKYLVVSPPQLQYSTFIDELNDKNAQGITITFKPKYQELDRPVLRAMVDSVFKVLFEERSIKVQRPMKHPKVILLYEVSSCGKFHYHGIMSDFPIDMIEEVRKAFSIIGRTEIKGIKYWDSYKKYILKRYKDETYSMIHEELDICRGIQMKQMQSILKFFQ